MSIVREEIVGEVDSVTGDKMNLVVRECKPPPCTVGAELYYIVDKVYQDGEGSVRVQDADSWDDGMEKARRYLETSG